jgi:hypothetical protein
MWQEETNHTLEEIDLKQRYQTDPAGTQCPRFLTNLANGGTPNHQPRRSSQPCSEFRWHDAGIGTFGNNYECEITVRTGGPGSCPCAPVFSGWRVTLAAVDKSEP